MILSRTAVTPVILILLIISGSCNCQVNTTAVNKLTSLKATLESKWAISDWTGFQKTVETEQMAVYIASALFGVTSNSLEIVVSISSSTKVLGVLSIIFGVLESVGDVINVLVFNKDDTDFAPVIAFLETEFDRVNQMLDRNFNEIKEVKTELRCMNTVQQFKRNQLLVKAFYNRFIEMLHTARHNKTEAMRVFDSELKEYDSSSVLLSIHTILSRSEFHSDVLTNCAVGNLAEHLKISIEFFETLQQAIVLDVAAKIRLDGLSKVTVGREREAWLVKVSHVVTLMETSAKNLVNSGWYGFFVDECQDLTSATSAKSSHDAAGVISAGINSKFNYLRVAVVIVEGEPEVTDASGSTVTDAGADKFLCYKTARTRTQQLLVLCRNWIVSKGEQKEVDSKFSQYRTGITSMTLIQALRNSRQDLVQQVMKKAGVTFFPIKVVSNVSASDAAVVQTENSEDFIFYRTGSSYDLQILVVTKVVQTSGTIEPIFRDGDSVRAGIKTFVAATIAVMATSLTVQ